MGFSNQPGESKGAELDHKSLQNQWPEPSAFSRRTHKSNSQTSPSSQALLQLDAWLDQLVHGDFQTRWEISKTLKQHPLGILGPLLALLSQAQEDEELLWFIARLLGEIEHPEAMETLAQILQSATTSEMQSVAVLALANRGRSALPTLTELLDQAHCRPLVVQVLSQIDAIEVVDLLLSLVADEDASVRHGTVEALSGFADPRIAPVLLTALQDHDSDVRRCAVRAVGARSAHLPGVALDQAIAPLLYDLNPKVVEQAITALGRLDTELCWEKLAEVLASPDCSVGLKLQAARAMGWSQSSAAIVHLVEQLDQNVEQLDQNLTSSVTAPENLALAREIVVVLGNLRRPQKLALAAQALESRLSTIFALGDGELKRATALTLGRLGQDSSFAPLCAYLSDSSNGLLFHIVATLRRLDPEQGLGRLQDMANERGIETETKTGIQAAIAEWS